MKTGAYEIYSHEALHFVLRFLKNKVKKKNM